MFLNFHKIINLEIPSIVSKRGSNIIRQFLRNIHPGEILKNFANFENKYRGQFFKTSVQISKNFHQNSTKQISKKDCR